MKSTVSVTAIAGGIGSGKSVVCKIVKAMGFLVYDCDSRAKHLMDNSSEIKHQLARRFGSEVIRDNGEINRRRLSSIVFADGEALEALNSIVHGAVRHDLRAWIARHSNRGRLFVETAILYPSRLDTIVDDCWEVEAPRELRICRASVRDKCNPAQIESRIASQENYVIEQEQIPTYIVVNDDIRPLLPQIENLLKV